MSTQDNLQAAFAGESQANRKYLAFAAKAEAEGRPQIAKLFRAAAAAETVHAHAHLRVMEGVGDTKQNLQAAIEGEGHEFQGDVPCLHQGGRSRGKQGGSDLVPQRQRRRKDTLRPLQQGVGSPGGRQGSDPCGHLCLRCLRPHARGRGPRQVPGVRSSEEQVQGSRLTVERVVMYDRLP